ncbi:MAG: hypothetical protein SGJ20_08790 [Planctomycetota bacterium]|nr:hypothetical protein [Planctomycetota bacterium]
MATAAWTLHQFQASTELTLFVDTPPQTVDLRCEVDLTQPADGLKIRQHGSVIGNFLAPLLPPVAVDEIAAPATQKESEPTASATSQLDCYVRGADLVITYTLQHRPLRSQFYLRLLQPQQESLRHAGIELIASVQTPLLDSNPIIDIRSIVQTGEILRLTDVQRETYSTPESLQVLDGTSGTGCFLIRLKNADWTYVEMVHPLDFCESLLMPDDQESTQTRLTHRLFAGRLEKGVVLRSRIRGVFVPRQNDCHAAAVEYQAFASSEPPLTT